jgi:arabinofuranan 3-O-arabinosyltransferase
MDARALDQLVTSTAATAASTERLIRVIALALTLGYLTILTLTFFRAEFLVDPQGRPIANDFVNVVAAGDLVRDGKAASAYDWPAHKAAEVRAVGHDFDDYYGWHYPPPFLFVAAALSTLPYLVAALTWLTATLGAYVAALRGILGRTGIFVALGFPAAVWNVTAGQNGFLTAALIGGTLGFLERRPVLAGVCLGLLTYKPQFGLLFPIVLIADRRWTTIGVAAGVTLMLAALSLIAFGSESWEAFLHWMPITSRVVLSEGHADFGRLQSLFGLVRAHGGSETLAWIVQAMGSIAVAAWLVVLWQGRAPYELKAAALAAGALLATPYLYMYDVVILAVAVAFFIRHALARGFNAVDIAALAVGAMLILAYPALKTQTGLAAVLLVIALVAQRARAGARVTPPAQQPGPAPATRSQAAAGR